MSYVPDFRFRREQVTDAAGKDPWRRQEAFSTEIDPSAIRDSAVAYRRAAEESDVTIDLGQRASALAADAGSANGSSLADAPARDGQTRRQSDPEGMERAVTALLRAANLAVETEERVVAFIEDGGLDVKISRLSAEAVEEWNGWNSALADAVPGGGSPVGLGQDNTAPGMLAPPVTVAHAGSSQLIFPTLDDGQAFYRLPPRLGEEIRKKYLDKAGDAARACDEDIADEITAYRRTLAAYAQVIDAEHVDLSEGPLDIFTTPQMAEFAGREVAAELEKDRPNAEALERWTAVMGAIVDDVLPQAPPFDGEDGAPLRVMTLWEAAYLRTFYDQLEPSHLSTLGRYLYEDNELLLNSQAPKLEYGSYHRDYRGAENLADGVQLLLDPAAGGIDPATPVGRDAVPEAIARHVYGPHVAHPGAEGSDEALHFGTLMSTTDVASGEQFSRDLLALSDALRDRHEVPGSYFSDSYREHHGQLEPAPYRRGEVQELYEGVSGLEWAARRNAAFAPATVE
ncbi:hypothetical protein [Streptomyces avicenniae]|uniref:hypothetical protein n=1 Tax=Streptomyces avicenniae TaxID=500153 RepID=UPI00069B6046|nr:hypothetical protein [Streptomyces avicenniae]